MRRASSIVNVGSDTVVISNLFYSFMTFMKDGAAVYCTGAKNVEVCGNVVFCEPGSNKRSYAYYLDELCEDSTVENNLAINSGLPMLSHMTRNCRYLNNIFMDRDLQTHSAPNTFGLAFERNLLIADSIEILTPKGNPEGLSSDFDTSEHMKGYSARTVLFR